MNELKTALQTLSEVDRINSGGCGIAAYATYLYLKKYKALSDDFAIVYLHQEWGFDDYETNQMFLTGIDDEVSTCSHAVVFYNDGFYDSNGEFYDIDRFDYLLFIEKDSIDRFMKKSLNVPKWNWVFKRPKELPLIEQNLGVNLGVDYKLKYNF